MQRYQQGHWFTLLCPQDLFIVLGTDGIFDVLSNQVPLTVGSSHSAAGGFERKVLAQSRPDWQTSCPIACNAWSLGMLILVCAHPGMHPRLFSPNSVVNTWGSCGKGSFRGNSRTFRVAQVGVNRFCM